MTTPKLAVREGEVRGRGEEEGKLWDRLLPLLKQRAYYVHWKKDREFWLKLSISFHCQPQWYDSVHVKSCMNIFVLSFIPYTTWCKSKQIVGYSQRNLWVLQYNIILVPMRSFKSGKFSCQKQNKTKQIIAQLMLWRKANKKFVEQNVQWNAS